MTLLSDIFPPATTPSGEINYILESDFESGTYLGWNAYTDAVGSQPIDGTGGAGAALARSVQNTTVLRGTKTFKLTKTAVNAQGQGLSYDFTIDKADEQKLLKIEFDYNTDGTYVDGDIGVYIYDITNATLITPSQVDLPGWDKDNNSSGKALISFSSTDSNSYRLIFHVTSTSASAYDLYLDNVIVGPGSIVTGAIVGPWVSETAITNIAIASGTQEIMWRRVGTDMEVRGYFASNNFASTGVFEFTVPDSKTVDTSALPDGTSIRQTLGLALGNDSSANTYSQGTVMLKDSTTLYITTENETISIWTGTSSIPFAWVDASDILSFHYTVPIAEWAGSGTTNLGANDVEYWSHDGTNVVRGSQGAVIPTATPAGISATYVLTGSDTQATDSVRLEIQKGGAGAWYPVGDDQITQTDYDGTNYIGAGLYSSGSTIQILQGKYRQNDDATTRNWSGLTLGTRWRVVKHRSGIPVGFGLATADNAGLVSLPDSSVLAHTPTGHGSTGTKIRTYTSANTVTVGNAITYTSDTVNGDTFTINEDGIYSVSTSDVQAGVNFNIGVSLNTSSLTTVIYLLPANEQIAFSTGVASISQHVTITWRMSAGDVVRMHANGTLDATSSWAQFRITQVAKL